MSGQNLCTVRVISLICSICAVSRCMQQQACVRWDIRTCKAQELFQEFIEYLSHSQILQDERDEDREGVSPEELL